MVLWVEVVVLVTMEPVGAGDLLPPRQMRLKRIIQVLLACAILAAVGGVILSLRYGYTMPRSPTDGRNIQLDVGHSKMVYVNKQEYDFYSTALAASHAGFIVGAVLVLGYGFVDRKNVGKK
jgi:hypothetical protein